MGIKITHSLFQLSAKYVIRSILRLKIFFRDHIYTCSGEYISST
jgi:hypothetical protein